MYGLCNVNIELTSRCNKDCWMCGRRKIDREYPEIAMNYGDMDFEMVKEIASQLPPEITVQFHNNGEPLLYEKLGEAINLFGAQTRCLTTNGLLLMEKWEELIMLDTVAISVIENDPRAEEQLDIITKYINTHYRPVVVIRMVGSIDPVLKTEYHSLSKKHDLIVVQRTLHSPMGSFDYNKKPVIPETGICREALHSLAIDRNGDVSCCVRFDPKRIGVVDNVCKRPISAIWGSFKRKQWVQSHKCGERNKVPLCSTCDFWGIPTSD